jgi:hypothetical protein
METSAGLIKDLYEKVEEYGLTTFELAKLKGLQTTTIILTALIAKMSAVVVFTLFFLVLSIGVAMWLGELMGKMYYGFFIIAGFYLLIGLLSNFFLHRILKRPIGNLIIKQVLN